MRWMNQMIEWDEWMRWMNEKNEWDESDEMKEWDESLWWKLKFIIVIKVHLDDENSSLWWRLIMSAEIHHNDADNWTEWWKMILQMKIYHSDENISQCWSLSLVDLRSPHWPKLSGRAAASYLEEQRAVIWRSSGQLSGRKNQE